MMRARVLLGACGAVVTSHALLADKTKAESNILRSPLPRTHTVVQNPTRTTMSDEELTQILTRNQITANLKDSVCHVNTFAANIPIEDSYAIMDGLGPAKDITLFGMFDGHSGGVCSEFCRDHLFSFILKDWKQTGKYILSKAQFLAADNAFLTWALKAKDSSGACANVMQLQGKEVTVANAGDCRAVLGRKLPNGTWEAFPLSKDHEISSNDSERERLLREHPNEHDVIFHDRIKGHLQPTRGMGDGVYKQIEFYPLRPRYVMQHGPDWHPPYSTAEPDIVRMSLGPEQQFIIMATDGLFMDLDNQQVVNVVANYIANPPTDKNAATVLVETALVTASQRAFGGKKAWMSKLTGEMYPQQYLSQLFASDEQRRRHIHDDITVMVVFLNQDIKPKL